MLGLMNDALSEGVAAYNVGDEGRCARVYENALRAVVRRLGGTTPFAARLLQREVERATPCTATVDDKAWALRRLVDITVEDLSAGAPEDSSAGAAFPPTIAQLLRGAVTLGIEAYVQLRKGERDGRERAREGWQGKGEKRAGTTGVGEEGKGGCSGLRGAEPLSAECLKNGRAQRGRNIVTRSDVGVRTNR